MTSNSTGIVVSHREYVGALTSGGTGFEVPASVSAYGGYGEANPGNYQSYPWLSRIAPNFEKFSFRKLKFTLIPAQPATATGRVWSYFDYDYNDPVPTSATEIMAGFRAKETNTWSVINIDVDCRLLNEDMKYRYVSHASRSGYVEPRTSNPGFLVVAWQAGAAGYVWDLIVEYEVELQIPQAMEYGVEEVADSTAVPKTDMVPVDGTYRVRPINTLPQSAHMPYVVSGENGAPTFGYGGQLRGFPMYDALAAGFKGVARFISQDVVTGSGGADFTTAGYAGVLHVCDANGVVLGSATQAVPFKSARVLTGPTSPTAYAATGTEFTTQFEGFLSALKNTYQTMRYIVPVLTAVNAYVSAGGTSKAKFQYTA
jgi:hypothetical protein